MGKPRNTRKYPTYPEIFEIPGNTRKKKRYPEIPDRIFRHSYPTRTRPATRYFVQYPTRPDPILKNRTRWALVDRRHPRAEHCWPANRHSYYTTGPALRECHTNILLISFKNTKVQNTTDIHIIQLALLLKNVTQIYYFFLSISF